MFLGHRPLDVSCCDSGTGRCSCCQLHQVYKSRGCDPWGECPRSPALLPAEEQSERIQAKAISGSLVTTGGSEWPWTIRMGPVVEPCSLMESFDFLPPGQRWGLWRSWASRQRATAFGGSAFETVTGQGGQKVRGQLEVAPAQGRSLDCDRHEGGRGKLAFGSAGGTVTKPSALAQLCREELRDGAMGNCSSKPLLSWEPALASLQGAHWSFLFHEMNTNP